MSDTNPLSAPIYLPYKDGSWFETNKELRLKKGQIVFFNQTGTHKIGDGKTQLKDLEFLPKVGGGVTEINVNSYSYTETYRITEDIVVPNPTLAYTLINVDGTISDSSIIIKRGKAIGITLEDTQPGFAAKVVTSGRIENFSWTWTQGDMIYINGTQLTNYPPSVGFIQSIGIAKSSSTIEVKIGIPILI